MNKRIIIQLSLLILIISLGMTSVNALEPELIDHEHCYEEGGYWYCLELSPAQAVPVKFLEPIMCISETDETCVGDCTDVIIGCRSLVEVTRDTEIEVKLTRRLNPEETEDLTENVVLSSGETLDIIIMPNKINTARCMAPELESEATLFLPDIYERNCGYEGEEYLADITYYGEGIVIHTLHEKERMISLPTLPTVMMLLAVLVVAIWVFYPQITKKMKKKSKPSKAKKKQKKNKGNRGKEYRRKRKKKIKEDED